MIFKDYFLHQSTAIGSKNHQKKFQAQIYPKYFFSVCPNMVKYGQKSTFDRKVVETPFFYQNDQNEILKIFPSV